MFLKAWKVDLCEKRLEKGGWAYDISVFFDQKPEYCAFAESIRRDFIRADRDRFDALHTAIVNGGTTGSPPDVVKAFDQMIEFVEAR